MTRRFEGKVALVTGASRGIGLAIAERLVHDGARVMLTARKAESLAQAAEHLGNDTAFVAGAADSTEHQDEAISTTLDRFGRLDFLVNNAGINTAYGAIADLEASAAAKILGVNVLAVTSWTQKALRAGLSDDGAAIVNVASIAGLNAAENIGMYGASKAALIHLTRQFAVELGPKVRVNGVAPGVVRTRFAEALYEGREEEVASAYPLRRLGTPEDVAGGVAFLLSSDAAWITGHTLVIDGGVTLRGAGE